MDDGRKDIEPALINLQINPKDELKFRYWSVINAEVIPETRFLSPKVFRKIDWFLDQGSTKDMMLDDLTRFEKEQFFFVLNKLTKKGIVRQLIFESNGKLDAYYLLNSLLSHYEVSHEKKDSTIIT